MVGVVRQGRSEEVKRKLITALADAWAKPGAALDQRRPRSRDYDKFMTIFGFVPRTAIPGVSPRTPGTSPQPAAEPEGRRR
jgi:hypothetical protein